ncbi:hypothetical protein [Botrimarina sp.]|uniref:hypothetical protein n=1 Tax=Botrimarina sp. TaxID=2795802 RepID=UPI0032F04665
MSDRLELPAELLSLVEKREADERRQAQAPVAEDRRSGSDRRSAEPDAADRGE